MTAPTTVDDSLVAKAREIVRAQGGMPSRNQLKTSLRVGSDKAKAVLDVLSAEQQRRRSDGVRQLRRIQQRGAQTRRWSRSLTGPRPGLSVPVSPLVGPLAPTVSSQVMDVASPVETTSARVVAAGPARPVRKVVTWPALFVAGPAFVAIWAGWVALGKLTGFGRINVLPGFGDGWVIDTAITLPIGVEAYAAYAFYVWLHPASPPRARLFAMVSSVLAVALGMGGQTAYHLMVASGMTSAPWQITTVVSCLPVAVFGLAATLIHLVRAGHDEKED